MPDITNFKSNARSHDDHDNIETQMNFHSCQDYFKSLHAYLNIISNKLPPRSPIPEEVKREVRQQAGFGCCKCGFPITQYHHVVERSEDSKDIMLLCPNHHWEATSRAMTREEQLHHKLNPINIEKDRVQGLLKINQKVPVVTLGTNQIIGEGDFILIDNESLLSLSVKSGVLEISTKLFDPAGQLIAKVENNEWISGDPFPWDLQSDYQWLTIHHKRRAIALEIDATVFPLRLRANLWFNQ